MLILLVIGILVCFIPSAAAIIHNKCDKGAIMVLNLFLGWTVFGWIVALIWATSERW
jgi:hypothetical protein